MNEEDLKTTAENRDDHQNDTVDQAGSDSAWVDPVALEEIAPDQILLDLADPPQTSEETDAEPEKMAGEDSAEEEPGSDVNLDHIDLSIMAQRWQSVRHDENLVQLRALDASLKASHIEEEAQLRAGEIAVARRFHNSILYRSRGVALGVLVFGISTWVGAVTFGDRGDAEIAQTTLPVAEEINPEPEPLIAAVPPQVQVIPHQPLQMIGDDQSVEPATVDEMDVADLSEEAILLSEPATPFAPPPVVVASVPVVEPPKVDLPNLEAPVVTVEVQETGSVKVETPEKVATTEPKPEVDDTAVKPIVKVAKAEDPRPEPVVVKKAAETPAAETPAVKVLNDPAFVLQFGAFGSKSNAEKLVAKLKGTVPGMRIDQREVASGKKLYIVSGGAFQDADAAQKMAKRLKTNDRIDSFVRPQTQLARS